MLEKERKYGFRERMLEVHKKGIRNYELIPASDEFEVKDGILINIGTELDCDGVIETAAWDFTDYLYKSMDVSASVSKKSGQITVRIADSTVDMTDADATKGFRIDTNADGITVYGFDARGCAQGLYYLEKVMSIRKSPFVKFGTVTKKPLFSPQMVHSGYQIDRFPNEHLAGIAHDGRDAIVMFVNDVDKTPTGYMDFNELIYRAKKYGIDVYAYIYFDNLAHPEDEGGIQFYENTYGKLFRECPKIKGIILVESSLVFPSKDPAIRSGISFNERIDIIPTGKPTTAGHPAYDMPLFMDTILTAIRKYNPEAELVAWNYNVVGKPEEVRHAWYDQFPEGTAIMMTVGNGCKYKNKAGIRCFAADYTLTHPHIQQGMLDDAKYVTSKGLKAYAMTNTGGITWDMGVMPYQPGAYLWMERYASMIKAAEECGICGLMESHHFGIYPSIISRLSNEVFRDPYVDMEKHLEDAIVHDFGDKNVEKIKKALRHMSDSNAYMTHSRTDSGTQNRVGAAFPFCIKLALKVPNTDYAHFGNRLMGAKYEDEACWNMDYRLNIELIPDEIKSWKLAVEKAKKGVEILETIENPNENLERLTALCKYICCQCVTGVHAKQWYLMKLDLDVAKKEDVPAIVEKMRALAAEEIKNTETAIECAELDSRLGWEPSMEYIAGPDQLRWKIAQVKYACESELGEYLTVAREEAQI